MEFLVDNRLFYPIVWSSSLVLWPSYFLIDSCWVHMCRKVRQSVLEFPERTHRVTGTDRGRGGRPSPRRHVRARRAAWGRACSRPCVLPPCQAPLREPLSHTLAAQLPRGWSGGGVEGHRASRPRPSPPPSAVASVSPAPADAHRAAPRADA